MPRGLLERRKGALPPIIVVLITMAAIVSAALITWFMIVSTRSATNRPILEVTDAYYLPSSGTSGSIFLTISNIGAVNVTVDRIEITCQSGGTARYTTSTRIPKGAAQSIKASVSGTINDGDLCTAQVFLLSPSSTSLTLSFRVVKP